ncbi:TetR/AcrR family transcriptional regulator [Candidatus Uabimicrobium sp. HlEnr_7]|uniref:TetR/AcrR family transcriptional regulator n=1 Tax=Candidatus Uabimicrobium helgolandensis TaxID=3095367 RepID=UPI003556E248
MKENILNLAEKLLLLRGYNAFSYKHISSELNIKNAAVHYHYPKKSDLGIAIIQRVVDRFDSWIYCPQILEMSPKQKIQAFFDGYWNICSKEGQEYICIVGSLLADYHTLPPEMTKMACDHTEKVISWLESVLTEGQQQQVFLFDELARDKAVVLISTVQGLLKLIRIYGDDLYKKACNDLLKNLLCSK